MCQLLQVSQTGYYTYKEKTHKEKTHKKVEAPISLKIKQLFLAHHAVYGTRKLKVLLQKEGYQVSRRKISYLMKQHGLVSVYTQKKYRSPKQSVNEQKIANKLKQSFHNRQRGEVLVSDLTYVKVGHTWHYICVMVDLFNREIVGYAAGAKKDAKLVMQAFSVIPYNLYDIQLFHTDRGSEFDNIVLDRILDTFQIERSLSRKGTPYDNAVAEATFKSIKTEFVRQRCFASLTQLQQELTAFVWWFNHQRIHGALGYLSPIQFKSLTLR